MHWALLVLISSSHLKEYDICTLEVCMLHFSLASWREFERFELLQWNKLYFNKLHACYIHLT